MFRVLAILLILLCSAPCALADTSLTMGDEPGFLLAAPSNVNQNLQLQGDMSWVGEADFSNGLGRVSVTSASISADYHIFHLSYTLDDFQWTGKSELGRRFDSGAAVTPWKSLQNVTAQARMFNNRLGENWRYWFNGEVDASYEKTLPGALGVGFDGGVAYDFWDGWMLGITARTVALSALSRDLFGDVEFGLAVAVSQKTLRRTLQSVGLIKDGKPGSENIGLNFALTTQDKTYRLASDNPLYSNGYLGVVHSKVGVYLDYLPNKALTFSIGPEYHYNRKYKLYNKTGSYKSSHDLDNALGGYARILWRF